VVDSYGTNLAALRQWLADVQVADRGEAVGAADLDLAFDCALDVIGYLDPTGGRDGSHDALELRARLRAVLRRTNAQHARTRLLRIRSLAIDTASREATLSDRALDLRRREYDLLLQLASEPRRVFHKRELLINLWGYPDLGTTRTLDSHASRLRRKLSSNGERWIINAHGVGYRLI
jgi:DNA-binding winged helix-turn-helix (wHTH) protein